MNTYISLLRGINVSGQKIVKMADLRNILTLKGFESVKTYIQSGNIIFQSQEKNEKMLSDTIRSLIQEQYNFDVPCHTLDKKSFLEVIDSNPFLRVESIDIKYLHVTFFTGSINESQIQKLETFKSNNDKYHLGSNVIYLYCPNGYAHSKYANNSLEKVLQKSCTTRNWKTMTKLHDLLKEYN